MVTRSARRNVHWQAPTSILLAFAVSLCLAIGHHLFYASLNRVPVDDNGFDQQTNIAIGTGFAFLIRACLAIATCTAYWQVFWHIALRKTLAVSSLDALTNVLGSLLEFANVRTVFGNPGLAALAILAWLVPFASLLPPATLSVLPASTMNSTYTPVPVPYFANVLMAGTTYRMMAGDQFISDSIVNQYLQASLQLSRMATTTALRGTVPEHQTLSPNSTYELDFNAPAIQCQSISQDILQAFNEAAGCEFTGPPPSIDKPKRSCNGSVPYVSWVPNRSSLVPFANGTIRNQLLPLDEDLGGLSPSIEYNGRYMGASIDSPPTRFVATRSQVPPLSDSNWDVLNCSLYNATYVVQFASDSNSRSLPHLLDVRMVNSVSFGWQSDSRDVNERIPDLDLDIFSYLGMMESLNRLLVGTIVGNGKAGDTIYWEQKRLRVQSPNLMATLLAFTREIVPLMARVNLNDDPTPDASEWVDMGPYGRGSISLPKEAVLSPSYDQSLGSAIEELFQNMTLSLFSDPRFLRNSEEPINVTRSYTRNTYFYSQRNLLLSYGIALFLTLLASISGCLAIFYNGASYTHKFSTILRTTAELGELVEKSDRTGADPLPKYMSRARVDLGRSDGYSQELRRVPGTGGERSAMIGSEGPPSKELGIVTQRTLSSETCIHEMSDVVRLEG
jgi:hypothetical protein